MKFAALHTFPGIAPDAYADLYFDEAFNAALGDAMKLGRTVLSFERTERRIVRRVSCEPVREKESLAAKVFGGSRASFVEELDYEVAARRGRWRTVPSIFADKVTTEGTIAFEADGTGTKRIVEGVVKAAFFGVAGMVERNIVAEISRSYARSAEFTAAWLARRAAPQ